MYLEFLAEDSSGKTMLEFLIPKIAPHLRHGEDYALHPHKGITHLKKKLQGRLNSFGKQYRSDQSAYIFVICDSDENCHIQLKVELEKTLNKCSPKPNAIFCIAIEEMEAWLLGDKPAILKAYPRADTKVLTGYVQDSVCGTWEKLADATCKGGSSALKKANPGMQKHEWAEKICPHMDIDANKSRSFNYFKNKLLHAAASSHAP